MNLVILSGALFGLGLYGVLTRRDLIAVLASVEVMLGGASVLLVGLAAMSPTSMSAVIVPADKGTAEAAAVLIIVLAAAEAAVALGIVVAVAQRRRTSRVDELVEVRG